ncbi:uncharacterized protein A4U43_C01F13670 [Asparagus officinalis]|uniref:Uncharacterized protein n=1 Tax=Asparagus officinalis TaxID=4686 RepID=A0A5P1FTS2_ASPOF|nr:uncharacterized protein A4U43_C01F13670 [Asparagus officinalis]
MANKTPIQQEEQESKPLAHPSPSPTIVPVSDEEANTQLSSSHYPPASAASPSGLAALRAFRLVLGLIILSCSSSVFKSRPRHPHLQQPSTCQRQRAVDLGNPFTPLSVNHPPTVPTYLKEPQRSALFKYDKTANANFYYGGQSRTAIALRFLKAR